MPKKSKQPLDYKKIMLTHGAVIGLFAAVLMVATLLKIESRIPLVMFCAAVGGFLGSCIRIAITDSKHRGSWEQEVARYRDIY